MGSSSGAGSVEMERTQRKRAVNQDDCSGDLEALMPSSDSDREDAPLDAEAAREVARRAKVRRRRLPTALLRQWRPAQAVVVVLAVWTLLALLWIRWPAYYMSLVPRLEEVLGSKQEVEPFVVSAAVAAPSLAVGALLYWRGGRLDGVLSSATRPLVRWAERHPTLGRLIGGDAVDVAALVAFAAVHVNLVAGKLLIDRANGKLAKAGVTDRLVRALGMNALYAFALSVLLVARQSFFHRAFSLSAERAARYHVFCGQVGGLLLLGHGLGYIGVWLAHGSLQEKLVPCLDEAACSPKQRYGTLRNFSGLVALLVMFVIGLGSLEQVRRRFFRRFTLLHCLTVPFVLFTALHYYPAVFWLVPAVIPYAMYRLASFAGRGQANVLSATSLSTRVLQLELRREPGTAKHSTDFAPGQYVYVQVDAISRREWHPFSISSSPLRNRHSFLLDVKVQGPFTTRMLQLARSNQLATVRVDGYYGTALDVSPHMVFVAGGSGMAPFLSQLEHLVLTARALDAAAAGGEDAGDEELPRTVWIVWSCRGGELLEAHADLLDAVAASPRWKTRVWLHATSHADDDDETEPDDEDVLTPRVERFHPLASDRAAFAGRRLLALPLFLGAVFGCVLAMGVVYAQFMGMAPMELWYYKRPLLLLAATGGATVGGLLVLWLTHPELLRSPPKQAKEGEGDVEAAALAPTTPRQFVAVGKLSGRFEVDRSRPDLRALLATAHGEIQENYGLRARVGVFVSGPQTMQREAVRCAREFDTPRFQVHEKSFAV